MTECEIKNNKIIPCITMLKVFRKVRLFNFEKSHETSIAIQPDILGYPLDYCPWCGVDVRLKKKTLTNEGLNIKGVGN